MFSIFLFTILVKVVGTVSIWLHEIKVLSNVRTSQRRKRVLPFVLKRWPRAKKSWHWHYLFAWRKRLWIFQKLFISKTVLNESISMNQFIALQYQSILCCDRQEMVQSFLPEQDAWTGTSPFRCAGGGGCPCACRGPSPELHLYSTWAVWLPRRWRTPPSA